MLKKTISYEDYNGVKRTEDFYFNLSRTELARMEMKEARIVDGEVVEDGLHKRLSGMVERGSGKEIIETFEWLIRESYGVRSEDGRRFIKSDEVFQEFYQSPAYDEFFMGLVYDAKAASEFVNGVVPEQISSGGRAEPQDHKKKDEKVSRLEVVESNATTEDARVPSYAEENKALENELEGGEDIDLSKLTPEQIEAIKNL